MWGVVLRDGSGVFANDFDDLVGRLSERGALYGVEINSFPVSIDDLPEFAAHVLGEPIKGVFVVTPDMGDIAELVRVRCEIDESEQHLGLLRAQRDELMRRVAGSVVSKMDAARVAGVSYTIGKEILNRLQEPSK